MICAAPTDAPGSLEASTGPSSTARVVHDGNAVMPAFGGIPRSVGGSLLSAYLAFEMRRRQPTVSSR
jgi:hypothetical protein